MTLGMSTFAADFTPADHDFFEKKIRPALVQHCYSCHSAKSEKIKGKLRVDGRAVLQNGGETGPALVPGNPEKSLLIEAIVYKNQDLQMPPESKLPDSVIQDMIAWVKKGAYWPDEKETQAVVAEKKIDYDALKREHWAFKPINKGPAPKTRQAAENPVDQFVLAKLEEKGLKQGAPASKHSLLRRVSFDLTGLPPTPEQIDAFVNDTAPDAFKKVVDALLASPRFGERWGRHWLDVARYAESAGGGRIVALNNAWRYREYVINAFNADKPYDQFLREQIAGDLMPTTDFARRGENVIATGFLAIGPKNLDTQDKDLLRMDVVDEQVDTIGKTILGMTIGCARCHDHKFDPITTKEYYALAGIFRSTKTLTPGNVSGVVQTGLPLDVETQKKIDEHDKIVTALEAKLHGLRADAKIAAAPKGKIEAGPAVVAAPLITAAPAVATAPAATPATPAGKMKIDPAKLQGIVMDDSQANIIGTWIRSSHTAGYIGAGYLHDNNTSKGELSVSFAPTFPKTGVYDVRVSYTAGTGRADRVPVIVQYANAEKTVEINQRLAPPLDGSFISIGKFLFNQGNDGSVTISNAGTNGHTIVDSVQFLAEDTTPIDAPAVQQAPVNDKPAEATAQKAVPVKRTDDVEKAALDKLEKEISELKKKAPAGPAALAVKDEEQTADYNICIRGDVHRLGNPVPRGFLSLAGVEGPKIASKQSGRVELADWLVDPRNVLTPRVMVNRIWHHLFGAGIVRTTDNFGLTGEAPSHPELLDFLSREFVEKGWSVKQAIRAIVLSRTYQLGSAVAAEAAKIDPDNRLLARANLRRLDAEAIRDAILFNSGQLELSDSPGLLTRIVEKTKAIRRTVYLSVERETLDGMLEVFDFADPNLVVGTRTTSNLATQALFLMNSPFSIEHARAAAKRLLAAPVQNSDGRIELAYLRALGRKPNDVEKSLAKKFLEGAGIASAEAPNDWASFCQALHGCVDFRFLD